MNKNAIKTLASTIFTLMLSTSCMAAAPNTAVFAWEDFQVQDQAVVSQEQTVLLDINHTDSKVNLDGRDFMVLAGTPDWALTEMTAAVEKAERLGASAVVFDIEDHYEALADNLELLQSGLPVYVCIPYWLDSQVLKRILKAADGAMVMNYWRGEERKHMKEEISIAKQYGKKLWTCYELQAPGEYGLIEQNTYYGKGMKAVEENYRKQFKGTDVGMAIHHLGEIR